MPDRRIGPKSRQRVHGRPAQGMFRLGRRNQGWATEADGIADECADGYRGSRSHSLPHFMRHLCIGLCFAFLAALNLHGLSQTQHDFAHAADWPAVALIEADDDHHAAHVHVAPDDIPDLDTDRDGDGPIPVGHHHHGGGDVHAAMLSSGRVLTETSPPAPALRRPGPDPALSSLAGDGPEYPPKRMRTAV